MSPCIDRCEAVVKNDQQSFCTCLPIAMTTSVEMAALCKAIREFQQQNISNTSQQANLMVSKNTETYYIAGLKYDGTAHIIILCIIFLFKVNWTILFLTVSILANP